MAKKSARKKKAKKKAAVKQSSLFFVSNAALEKIKFDLPPTITAEMPFVIHSDATIKELLAALDKSVLGGLLVLDKKTREVKGAFTKELKAAKGCKCGGGRGGYPTMKKCAKSMFDRHPNCERVMCDQPTINQEGEITSCRVTCLDGHLGGSIDSILDQEGPGGNIF